MSETQSQDGRNVQQTDSKANPPFEDDLRERPRDIPSNVLSLNFSEHSEKELAEMYESSRTIDSAEKFEQARQRAPQKHTVNKFDQRYNRARGRPARAEPGDMITSTDLTKSLPSITDYDVKEVICDEFGKEGWSVMRPLLATHATLLIDDIQSSRAIMVEGQSGTGKTMLLKTFGGLGEQFCRRSDITPASFVSAGSSNSNDNSENTDLLPQLEGRTLAVRDAQTLFTGSEQTVRSRWGKLARIMDGDGYYRQTATHGKAGYDEIRFNFMGATTPLTPRAWNVMGNVGQRLLFIEWPEEDYENGWLGSMVDGGERQPIERGQAAVQEFLQDLWTYHGGPGSVVWTSNPMGNGVERALEGLATVVTHARGSLHDGSATIEAPKRIGKILHDLARGHALVHGRTQLKLEDVEVCGQVAMSTMPSKRRGVVRALLNPDQQKPLTPSDVEDIMGVSRPTARDRINEVAALGLGEKVEVPGRGGTTTGVRAKSEFSWPDELVFPEF